MTLTQNCLILASTSRYRRTMLERLAIPFRTESSDVDETPRAGELPAELSLRLAVAKAKAVADKFPGCIVIGADQVATLGHEPIGKAGSFDAAFKQLKQLSGQIVQFHSALAVTDGNETLIQDVLTACHFRELSDEEITHYLEFDQPFDTAGSAKAESLGISLMESMRSDDPTAIIGLPLIELCRMLRHFGLNPTLTASSTNLIS
ncbi:MAG: septum formation protein Maf [Alcaligenaceae bacterium]|jgi:septum formation protein|nr:septum formation protein Maf [Alcaligenaceae bacterium]